MIMISHRPNNKKKSIFVRFVVTVLIVFGLFSVNRYFSGSLSRLAQEGAWYIANLTVLLEKKSGNFFAVFARKQTLLSENQKLKEENRRLRLELSQKKLLQIQNNALQRYVTARATSQENTMHPVRTFATVISTVGVVPHGTLLLSGDMKYVSVGDRVLLDNLYMVGVVISKTKHTATVQLLSASGQKTPVIIRSHDSANSAEALGVGSGNFILKVPRDMPVAVGDMLYASRAHQYAIGVVGDRETHPTDSFATVRARLPISLQALQYLIIEQSYARELQK